MTATLSKSFAICTLLLPVSGSAGGEPKPAPPAPQAVAAPEVSAKEVPSAVWRAEMHRLLGRARAAPEPKSSPDLLAAKRLLLPRVRWTGGGDVDAIIEMLFQTEIYLLEGDQPHASAMWEHAVEFLEAVRTISDLKGDDPVQNPFAYERFLDQRYPSLREHESKATTRRLVPVRKEGGTRGAAAPP